MPRPDLFESEPRAFRSGFWATVPVAARDRAGDVELSLAARLADGSEHVAPLGRIAVAEPSRRRATSAADADG